ncbi:MAG: efflux RND transporter periplasmic adaptor subunit [Rhodospirillales bacterium]|nr:efflux RND transporter periplasmic adaptor subunit [Rhodospirillales bacterium]
MTLHPVPRPGEAETPPAPAADPAPRRGDGPARRPRLTRRHLLFAGVLATLVAAAAGTWTWWRGPPVERYVTATVERGAIEDSTTALGTLQPFEFVDVGTQVSGQLRKIHVEIGAAVKEGDLLAEIDPAVYQAKVDASRAQLLNLKAQLADKRAQLLNARRQFQRESNLMKAKATSEEAYQNAEAALGSATAQVDALKAQIQNTESVLRVDETNLGFTKIHAPMTGTVVAQIAKQGQTLNANQQAPIVLRIADLSTMTVWTQVSEADIGRLRIDMDVYFTTLGQSDRRWRGKLRQILPTPEIVNNVVLYNALFDVPNPTGELLPQMSAQVFFVSARARNALVVPMSALKPAGDKGGNKKRKAAGERAKVGEAASVPVAADGAPVPARYKVHVLTPGGGIEERDITVGITNRVSAQVLSGLEEGERVVVGAARQSKTGKEQPRPRPPRLS